MNIVLCTIPIRPEPTTYPPFGSLALIQSLRDAGYDPYFYDIDALRPKFEDAVEFFRQQSPDVVGISAVVSTAYAYTKELARAIHEVSPRTKIVVGGNLAASAEILLRFCEIDACVVGEGEKVIVNLTKYWEQHPETDNNFELEQVRGITYLNQNDEIMFTGYEVAIAANEFLDPDWKILEQFSQIQHFTFDPLTRFDFAQDPRSRELHRQGKLAATVPTAKGCVARCTFCHRWDKGYRHWPVDRIVANIKRLIDDYNVGFILFGDENFGSDRRKADQLLEELKSLDILFIASGVRCRSVDPDFLHRMKDAGCVALYYGMETGSPRMLEVMEKNATLQHNIDAARWTHEAGLYTNYQMVLAMPGESAETVAETTDFLKKVTEFLPDPPWCRVGINYIQALPGTPVYEYARNAGLIGKSLEAEEEYLLKVSNIDASDEQKFINFTAYDYLTVQSWRPSINFECAVNWYKKRGWKTAATGRHERHMGAEVEEDYTRGGYFNMGHVLIHHPLFFRMMSFPLVAPLRMMYSAVYVLLKDWRAMPKRQLLEHIKDYFLKKLRKGPKLEGYRSLRKIMNDETPPPASQTEESMQPLRLGR